MDIVSRFFTLVRIAGLGLLLTVGGAQAQAPEQIRVDLENRLCSCACGEQGWACGAGASCHRGGALGCVCEGFGRGECAPSASCVGAIATGSATKSALICPARRAPTDEEKRILAEKVARLVADQDAALSSMDWWNFGTTAAEVADALGTASQHGLSVMVPSAWIARFGAAAIRIGATVIILDAARGAVEYGQDAIAQGASNTDAALCALAGGAIGGLVSAAGQNMPVLSGEVDKLMRIGWRWLKSPVDRKVVIGFAAYTGMTLANNVGQAIQKIISDAAKSTFISSMDFKPRPVPQNVKPVNLGGIGHRW